MKSVKIGHLQGLATPWQIIAFFRLRASISAAALLTVVYVGETVFGGIFPFAERNPAAPKNAPKMIAKIGSWPLSRGLNLVRNDIFSAVGDIRYSQNGTRLVALPR